MKLINKINNDLIEIIEFAKPNACFQTNEYPDNYDFIVLREIFNPFDLFNDNKIKDVKIERLNNIIKECAEDILKELEENHHLSYGVALAIRQKLLDYKELKGE